MSTKFIPIQNLAKKLGVSRGKIYWKIINGSLKEGRDFKKIIVRHEVLVVRDDLKV